MVILFIVVGAFFGAIAASIALISGGSVLFALVCYSIFGTLAALAVVYALFVLGGANENAPGWGDGQKANDPISA